MKFITYFIDDATSKRSKLKYLGKQLKSLKHTMNDLEMDFEMKHGYKPSHVRKLKNVYKLYVKDDFLSRLISMKFLQKLW